MKRIIKCMTWMAKGLSSMHSVLQWRVPNI
jgi:hypothetical protein